MARVAIVTGGTRGIGEAISIALRDQGMKVAANYAGNEERAREFTERTGIPAFKWDVSDFEACQHGVGKVDAGSRRGRRAGQQCRHHPRHDYEAHGSPEVAGSHGYEPRRLLQHGQGRVGRHVERGYGRIVNIGSINGQAGQYGQVNYAAAKSGIHGFTKALAQEGARDGVTVNAIAPGYIDTDMVAAVPRKCWARSSPRFRSTALAAPTRSPAVSLSWSTRTPVSSPARRCRSTAASTCIDERRCCLVARSNDR